MIKVNGIEVTKGCKVKFRCGGSAKVIWLQKSSDAAVLKFKDDLDSYRYYWNGKLIGWNGCSYQFDIIEVIPPAFDWDDAKWGMAFKSPVGDVWIYLGEHISDRDGAFYCPAEDRTTARTKSLLTRAPEHDIIEEQDR